MEIPEPTNQQLQVDLEELKNCIYELSALQKLQILEIKQTRLTIKNNRLVNSRRLTSVGNRLFRLMLLTVVGGSAIFVYQNAEASTRNKIAESYITQLIPVVISVVGAQQLLSNRQEQHKLKEEDDEDTDKEDDDDELLNKYLTKHKKTEL